MSPIQAEPDRVQAAGLREFVSFRLAAQEFCVDIMSIREIRGWTAATPLPRSPAYVKGVINLRGAVLPIVDLASRLGFESSDVRDRNVIIVAQVGEQIVGLLVDAVSDILTIREGAIQPIPAVASDVARSFMQGLIPMDALMISLIDLDRVLPPMQAEAA